MIDAEEKFVRGEQVIPTMTHPMSEHWDQPDRSYLRISDKRVIMCDGIFRQFHEYSTSQPNGVYDGKMWKSHVVKYRQKKFLFFKWVEKTQDYWLLKWFGPSQKPDHCTTFSRVILIGDKDGR